MKSRAGWAAAFLGLAGAGFGGRAVLGAREGAVEVPGSEVGAGAYERIVAPIFRARCIECHGEEKQKAELALHTWEAAAKGSDAGPIWVAGKPVESVILEMLRLPLDDELHMPPGDRPQPAAAEIELIEHWIVRGASRELTVEELSLPPALAAAAEKLPAQLAAVRSLVQEPVWHYDPADVAQRRAARADVVAKLQRRFPGALSYVSRTATELTFTAAGFGPHFGDRDLEALAPLGDALVSLDLSRTGITEQAAAVLSRFPRLRVFRAGFTAVGDKVAAAVAVLPELELVALNHTSVTAASVPLLARLTSLRTLRLAGTPADEPARAAKLPVEARVSDS